MDIEDIIEVNENERWLETRDEHSANQSQLSSGQKSDSFLDDNNPIFNILSSAPSKTSTNEKRPTKRKTALWTTDEIFSNDTLNNRNSRTAKRNETYEEQTEVVPIIPDLEDVVNEEFTKRAAEAPKMADSRLISYKDLKKDSEKISTFASIDGIDLKLLTKNLLNENQLHEDDSAWSWDSLISEINCHVSVETVFRE
ncbi:hypothetical protein B4U79_09510 [Dinothrombium tinctorium]|uniref:Intraflagellar transport protein 43-like protein n=1 Tax=Dinothrombium tinctorium TaxID=1965070 RepID=A0A3S4QZ42_9ACAR|nr:hypothetical protein B4U79_11542 [Dinothrombium tinctorium]RWS09591.1 hypothetical protein B4U79_06962 [Dinothrombium tinctorium]RWS11558.1 hypothetical protein B4U79_09510 [Dinothrombium tinctorium]